MAVILFLLETKTFQMMVHIVLGLGLGVAGSCKTYLSFATPSFVSDCTHQAYQ